MLLLVSRINSYLTRFLPNKRKAILAVTSLVVFLSLSQATSVVAQEFMPGKPPFKYKVDHRIDNMGYWKRMAELGLVPVAPFRKVPSPVWKSSILSDASLATYDSPDIPVTHVNSTQSENSIFVSPSNRFTVLNSNNGSNNPYPGYFFGADDFFSADGGEIWDGQVHGAGGDNMGDPSAAINSNGRWFVGYIHSGGGQAISYSNDGGATWKVRAVASPPQIDGSLLDKPHLWVDNSPSSTYKGNLYDGWTVITGPLDGVLQISRSTDNGLAWQMPVRISDSVHAGSHNQGINFSTGPDGQVYAAWSVYDGFPADEKAIGFARSFNGGANWQPAIRAIDNIRGIRIHGVSKSMRTNSFPSMAVDISNSPWRGTIYIVWANVGIPGENSGNNVDVYMIHSADSGSTWSPPVRINQDMPIEGKQHFFPWISCDPANGNLAVVFYDDRFTLPDQLETWVAASTDGGANWQDFRVSDVAFTPQPVTGLSDDYFGDYLGISINQGMVYPCWTDNRTGVAMTYVSPFRLGPAPGQAYIAYQSNQYNDTIGGNGNGIPEYGESASLNLKLRNMGDQADTGIAVTLSCRSPLVTFSDSTAYIDHIGAGETASLLNEFSFSISAVIPNRTRLVFTVTAVDHLDSTYQSSFTLQVSGPELIIKDFIVDDSASNNSHSLDPGETALIKIRLLNPTQYTATNTTCSMTSPQSFIHLADTLFNIGEVPAGEWRDAKFGISVDSVRTGTLASFATNTTYSGLEVSRLFNKKIGLIFEDWESAGFSKFSWEQGGDVHWTIDTLKPFEGKYCLRSGMIGDMQKSTISVSCRALTDDSISFYRKTSTENRYDFLKFYIDSVRVGQWSGELDWERVVFPLLPGRHTLKWEYAKDQAVTSGLDAAFIDFIEFPSIQYTTADAGPNASIFECENFNCIGTATYYDSLRWVTTGAGHFDNPTKERTKYRPGESDKEAGSVTLILRVYGPSASDFASDSMNLSILPRPTSNAGFDAGICAGGEFQVTGASATNYKTLSWYSSGTGVFNDRAILLPMYHPSAEDYLMGSVKLVLNIYASNIEDCGVATDTMLLTFYPLPVIPLEKEYTRCAGYSADLNASIPGGVSYAWQPGGQTSPEVRIDTAGVGIGKANYKVSVTDEHGCSTDASLSVEFTNCTEKQAAGNIFFRVYPNPVQDDFYVEFYTSINEKVSWQLSNDAGSVILQSPEFEFEGYKVEHLDLHKLSQGTYVFTVRNGDKVGSKKIIVI
ncbi:MAG: T9SS type A sorting domain-containing protein [Bacteroidetes bacterium]|nr:T9SS type A sorting domain-containing protein [Bacteroidota bacterium]